VRPSSSFIANWFVLEETVQDPAAESAADRLALPADADAFAAAAVDCRFAADFVSDPGVDGVAGLLGVPGAAALPASLAGLVVAEEAPRTPAQDASTKVPLKVLVFISFIEPDSLPDAFMVSFPDCISLV